jgi:ubiquinone/menaquinone biosynthesis C-methylase UbiE
MKPSLPQEAYETLADAYAQKVDTKPHNAFYERPTTLSLIGNVRQQTILDAGCGPGVYTKWLLDKGANVIALDASEKMLVHARKRTEGQATFYHANLEEPLPFLKDGSVDGIVSALTITYVRDHNALFAEFRRVLRSGGWLVFSTEHPFFSYGYFKIENYFETQEVGSEWTGFGEKVYVPSYYHSLGSICEALSTNGFLIERVVEPKPTEEFRAADLKEYEKRARFPLFICFRVRKEVEVPYA